MSSVPVSVIVPAFNAERYIAEALESVLPQLPAGSEVIVVDDGSTDRTAEVAERYGPPVAVIRADHQGIAGTLNRAASEVRGSFIAGVDADDRWLPGKLEKQLAALEDPAVDAVFGQLRQFISPELTVDESARFAVSDQLFPGLVRGVMLIRREAFERVGSMETGLTVGEFISWYARAVDCGVRMKMLPDLIYERRVHGANTVILQRDAQSDYLRIVKATLDRRRAAGSTS